MNIQDPAFKDLFAESSNRFEIWERILTNAKVETMVEVGVWKGDYAKHILKKCGAIQRYYMIDPWANLPDWNKPANVESEVFEQVFSEAMTRTRFASSKITVLRGRTKEVIEQIPDNSLDFAYVDGDHTLRGITIDLIRLLPKIKEGGIIGGDDFTNTPWQHDKRFEPTLVCPFSIYFSEAMAFPILGLPFNQFILQKNSNANFEFIDTTGEYHDISLNKFPLVNV